MLETLVRGKIHFYTCRVKFLPEKLFIARVKEEGASAGSDLGTKNVQGNRMQKRRGKDETDRDRER